MANQNRKKFLRGFATFSRLDQRTPASEGWTMSDVTRVEAIYLAAIERADPIEQAAYLESACGADAELRRKVDELLAAHSKLGRFLQLNTNRTHDHTPEVESEPLACVGDRVGPYKLLEKIGEGGMGEVWVADQLEPIKRRVALKLIKPGMDSRSVLARFEAERQALAVMDHPNIAKVLDAGTTTDGRPYFVMELVKGTPITEFCDTRKLSPKERLELFIPVCQAIQHAHMKGIIHRDIKPSNVLVELHDDRAVPKVIDFGVAKAIGQQLTEKTIYTGFGALVGTPVYMAPEQATFNALDVDTRADIYALGVLLYELLAGSPPIEAERMKKAALDEVLRIVRDEEPPRPSQRLSTSHSKASIAATRQSDPAKLSALMKGEIDWIVMKALEKDRTRRYDTANGLAKDIQRYLSGDSVEACPPTLGYRLKKAYRRNRNAVLGGTAFAMLLLLGILGTTLGLLAARDAARVAQQNERKAQDAEQAARDEQDKTQQANQQLERVADLQHRTRYAAEMNLLQAAYDSQDMARVKRLLEDQIPKGNEADMRGPEWHYWDRKFHRHLKEVCIPTQKDFEPDIFAISPEGSLLAGLASNNPEIQVWDTSTGSLKHSHRLSESSQTVNLALFHFQFDASGTRLLFNTTVWDLMTGQLYSIEEKARLEGFRKISANFEVALCDLRAKNNSPVSPGKVTVIRVADGKQLFTKENKRGGHLYYLSPDGSGLLEHNQNAPIDQEGKTTPVSGRSTQRQTLTFWKLGGAEPVKVWQQELTGYATGVEIPGSFVGFHFEVDGKLIWDIVHEDGRWVQRYFRLDTGEVTRIHRLLQISDQAKPEWVISQGMTQLSASNQLLAFSNRKGISLVSRQLSSRSELYYIDDSPQHLIMPRSTVFECLDGPPQLHAFRPDGTLLTVHTGQFPNPPLDKLKIKTWDLREVTHPPSSRLHRGAFSPNGSMVAIVLTDPPKSGNAIAIQRRLVVLNRSGEEVLSADCSRDERVIGGEPANPLKARFFGEDRYISVACQTGAGATRRHYAVIWDLNTKQKMLSIDLPAGEDFFDLQFEQNRMLISSKVNVSDQSEPFNQLMRSRLYEFPSGKLITSPFLKESVSIAEFRLFQNRVYWLYPKRQGSSWQFSTWSALDGKALGLTENLKLFDVSFLQVSGQERHVNEWLVRMVKAKPFPGVNLAEKPHVEVWNQRELLNGGKPMIKFPEAFDAYLRPDGTRMLGFSPQLDYTTNRAML
jgi:serine/threonine protein kinase/WD40 repeat protein